jgi:hypothetical protein
MPARVGGTRHPVLSFLSSLTDPDGGLPSSMPARKGGARPPSLILPLLSYGPRRLPSFFDARQGRRNQTSQSYPSSPPLRAQTVAFRLRCPPGRAVPDPQYHPYPPPSRLRAGAIPSPSLSEAMCRSAVSSCLAPSSRPQAEPFPPPMLARGIGTGPLSHPSRQSLAQLSEPPTSSAFGASQSVNGSPARSLILPLLRITPEIESGPQAGVRGERALGRASTEWERTLGEGLGALGEGRASFTA